MNAFADLEIFTNKNVIEQLHWYYKVATNKKPAKYLIAKRIPVDFVNSDSQENLWVLHKAATLKFLDLFSNIQNESLKLEDIPLAEKSLLDLNSTLAYKMLEKCDFCAWDCKVNRTGVNNKLGACQLEVDSRVGSFFHHRGEEIIFRGRKGSGTIFFTSCNMRCSFCQNGNISKDKSNGIPVTPELVASMAYKLGVEGCHNINFVGGDPTIHLHTIIEAIRLLGNSFKPSKSNMRDILPMNPDFFFYSNLPSMIAYNGEFNVPMLWNSNFFMSEKTMNILRTLIDVWLPDHKFSNNKCSIKLSRTPKYIETVSRNLLLLDEWKENYAIRHLIMPNHVECCTKEIFTWINQNIPKALINVMDQYNPDCFANPISSNYNPKYEEISRHLRPEEINQAYKYAKQNNLNFEALTFEKNISGIKF